MKRFCSTWLFLFCAACSVRPSPQEAAMMDARTICGVPYGEAANPCVAETYPELLKTHMQNDTARRQAQAQALQDFAKSTKDMAQTNPIPPVTHEPARVQFNQMNCTSNKVGNYTYTDCN